MQAAGRGWVPHHSPAGTAVPWTGASTRAFSIQASGHSTQRSAATPRSIPARQNEKLASYLVPFSFENSIRAHSVILY